MSEERLTPEQAAALALDRNVAVTAGAGTGKTFTLKERYRHILEEFPSIEPEEILVITFTNDAANELEGRIREVVAEELDDATAASYERWRRVRDGLDDAYIHTIHAFCSRVLREFAPAATVDPEFDTLDQTEADRLATEAIASTLDGVDPTGDPQSQIDRSTIDDDIRRLSRLYNRSRLGKLLSRLLTLRPVSRRWATRWATATEEEYLNHMIQSFPPAVSPAEAGRLIEDHRINDALDVLCETARMDIQFEKPDSGLDTIRELEREFTSLDTGDRFATAIFLERLCDHVTTGEGSLYTPGHAWRFWGSKKRWNEAGLQTEHQRVKDAFKNLIDILDPESRNLDHRLAIAKAEAPYALSLARVFDHVNREYERQKTHRHALDYADLIERATNLLRSSEQAREALRSQFRFLMIDEVQDTDPRQWDIVRLLSGEHDDRYDGQNVFLVGDEKQSIYRFRGADVAAFQRERERLTLSNPDGKPAEMALTRNFRSLELPLTLCNHVFDRLFRPAGFEHVEDLPGDGYERFEAHPQPLDAGRTDGTDIDGSVEYLMIPKTEADEIDLGFPDAIDAVAISPDEREAFAVAARLTLLFDGDAEVYDEDEGAIVDVAPRHVAMLFRSKSRLETFERALETYDIPYTNLVGSGFYDTPEIRPLLNLLKTLEDPRNDVALYGTLRSPLFGLSDAAVVEVAGNAESLWDGMAHDPTLTAARELIHTWRVSAGLTDAEGLTQWSSLITRIIDDTGYLASIGADERPHQAVANVEKFRERLRSWEDATALSLSSVIERIETERAGETDPAEAAIPGDIDGVQLRTIHGSKGLQFPVVIIPELGRKFNLRSNLPSAYLEEIHGEPIVGLKTPDPEASFSTVSSPAYLSARERMRDESRAEEKRVLYVAMTRARDHLLLSGLHEAKDGRLDSAKKPAEASRFTDWLQPVLLGDTSVLETLRDSPSSEATLVETPYRVARPSPAVDWRDEDRRIDLPTTLDIDRPPRATRQLRISATGFRDGLIDQGLVEVDAGVIEAADSVAATDLGTLDAGTFGDIVHKLCELRLPEDAWPDTIQRSRPTAKPLDTSVVSSLTAHARRGIETVESIHARNTVLESFDEFPITLRLAHGRVVGDIDHLVVTETALHVVDYKTSDLSRHSIEELVTHYLPQLHTYACALFQASPSIGDVHLHLVFTHTGAVYEEHLDGNALAELVDTYERAMGSMAAAVDVTPT